MANTTLLANYLIIADVDIAKPTPKKGLTVFCLDTKKRYFSSDGLEWREMTDLDFKTTESSDEKTHELLELLIDRVAHLITLIQGSLS